eukprot:GSChrysophyteH1.ASY1.ANO1.1245.1 assembled CDS
MLSILKIRFINKLCNSLYIIQGVGGRASVLSFTIFRVCCIKICEVNLHASVPRMLDTTPLSTLSKSRKDQPSLLATNDRKHLA